MWHICHHSKVPSAPAQPSENGSGQRAGGGLIAAQQTWLLDFRSRSKCEGASARLDVRFHSDSDRVADFGAILKSAKIGLEAMMSAYVQ
jgi:hypothetical protein